MSLVADALLNGSYYNAWRHLRRLEVQNMNAIPAALSELFSYLIVVVTEGVSVSKAAMSTLQNLITVAPAGQGSAYHNHFLN